jgi:hypothetical protein
MEKERDFAIIPLTECWFKAFIATNFIDRMAIMRSYILWNDLMAILGT